MYSLKVFERVEKEVIEKIINSAKDITDEQKAYLMLKLSKALRELDLKIDKEFKDGLGNIGYDGA